jgi:hypothetical protein
MAADIIESDRAFHFLVTLDEGGYVKVFVGMLSSASAGISECVKSGVFNFH